MTEPEDPFFRKVADYFIMRRGRGVMLASSDHDRLRTWRERGVHHFDVMEAIDTAFRKSREAPASLAAVAPYVQLPPSRDESELDALLSDSKSSRALGSRGPSTPGSSNSDSGVEDGLQLVDVISNTLRDWEGNAKLDPAARTAARELRRELAELADEGEGIDSDTLGVLDDAYALNTFRALDQAQRRRVEASLSEGTQTFDPRERPEQLRQAIRDSISYPSEAIELVIGRALRS